MNLRFEWDEAKASANLKKHNVSFEDAMYVFQDENRIEFYDAEHSITEDRYVAIGMVGTVLFVVFTERRDVTRIISARKANAKERNYYNDNIHY
jgi:uncharacterized protein